MLEMFRKPYDLIIEYPFYSQIILKYFCFNSYFVGIKHLKFENIEFKRSFEIRFYFSMFKTK